MGTQDSMWGISAPSQRWEMTPSFSLLQKAASQLQMEYSRGMKAVATPCESQGTRVGTPEASKPAGLPGPRGSFTLKSQRPGRNRAPEVKMPGQIQLAKYLSSIHMYI